MPPSPPKKCYLTQRGGGFLWWCVCVLFSSARDEACRKCYQRILTISSVYNEYHINNKSWMSSRSSSSASRFVLFGCEQPQLACYTFFWFMDVFPCWLYILSIKCTTISLNWFYLMHFRCVANKSFKCLYVYLNNYDGIYIHPVW